MSLTPGREDGGRTLFHCFEVQSPPYGTSLVDLELTADTGPSFCVVLQVERCAYCVPEGSTLQNIARHEFLNVDWLRLYNSNPYHLKPDTVLGRNYIKLGPVYSVQAGDSLLSIAAAAKTTVRSILENNADLITQVTSLLALLVQKYN